MRVIITGGTGLIGSALAANLAKDGHETIVLSRNPARHAGKFPQGVQILPWDARSASGWGHLADGADAIVNLAGENLAGTGFFPSRWTAERKRRIRDSRLNAGKAVVEAVEAASLKPRVVIQASAVGYYGPLGDEIVDESHPPANDFLGQLCQAWEASTRAVETMGVRQAAIRTAGIVLSPTSGALPLLMLPYRLFVGGPLGDGKQWYAWIHPADEVAAIRFLIEMEDASGPYNLASPEPLTNAQFGQTLGRVLGRPSWFPVPGFALRLLFGEVASVVLTGQRVIPKRLQEAGFTFQFGNLESALRDLLK